MNHILLILRYVFEDTLALEVLDCEQRRVEWYPYLVKDWDLHQHPPHVWTLGLD